jgi:hypothetical protein
MRMMYEILNTINTAVIKMIGRDFLHCFAMLPNACCCYMNFTKGAQWVVADNGALLLYVGVLFCMFKVKKYNIKVKYMYNIVTNNNIYTFFSI